MAFTVLPARRGKHRRPPRISRIRAALACVAVLNVTGAGAVSASTAAPAAASAPASADGTTLAQCVSVGGSLADSLAAQADAQRKAADEARRQAEVEAAKKKAEAERRAEAARKAEAERRAEEAEAERRAARAAERARLTSWVKPVDSVISTAYRAAGGAWSSGHHTGVDFRAAYGTSVKAVGKGTVVEAGWGGSYGNNVVIRMEDGVYTQYAHLASTSVSAGQTVTGGQQIGVSGSTGNSTGPHLHFEARATASYGSDIDPLAYLRSHGVGI